MAGVKILVRKRFLLTILIIASFLRLWGINKVPISLFSDEIDVGYQAYSIIKTGKDYFGNSFPLYFHSYADFRTPLYIYLTVPSVYFFGITALGVRLPASIFGILSIWAMYLLVNQLMGYQVNRRNDIPANFYQPLSLLSAGLLALSPWHIQYSRAAFEATLLLTFLLLGFYFFFKFLNAGNFSNKSYKRQKLLTRHLAKFFFLSLLFLSLTPWIYSTAKLFSLLVVLFLVFMWREEIFKLPKNKIILSAVFFLFLFTPSIFITSGSSRFGYISVFSDPTTQTEVDYQRFYDAQVRSIYGGNIFLKVASRIFHNKLNFWGEKIVDNILRTFSTEFLFIKGDLNLRHSIEGVGQFYKVEFISLILGIILFFTGSARSELKFFVLFWILLGTFPAAITRDGGSHATRLILILPPFVFLISYGVIKTLKLLQGSLKFFSLIVYFLFFFINFFFYQHKYWVENPWYSERFWHAGYKELVDQARANENKFKKIIISNANDDPRIFLAGYYPFEPSIWQKGKQKEKLEGFGELEHIGKFYFGQVDGEVGIDRIYQYLDKNTLYIATQREIKGNLVMEPQKTPKNLRLIKTIFYPSGEPAFYFLTLDQMNN